MSTRKKGIAWSLWIPVTLAFVLVIVSWSILIKIAKENPTEMVPLETAPAESSDE
ncbi:hypothetical protein [Coraliomargarita akajimensis]|uniref:Uncharacterized protein n=1 Tax=Coraliomargarita akajimensis (strain DSM 45221 / IAM 15411 / JCM 23193 / KCTC 12865 / 04OKA010-24) TaxID=583355 RepID=D5EJ87_CORAD|nr:hypothetical protein [Coraliomargarita akajimensis]ADE54486.1 hypothetical protein Caka_1467 [Coraliomargarita akajimensis DSM 45221]